MHSLNGIPANDAAFLNLVTQNAKAANVHCVIVHSLRHSHTLMLVKLGENSLDIKERLGHKDIQTTFGTYGHLYPNSNFKVAHQLNGVFDEFVPRVKRESLKCWHSSF